MGCQSNFMAFYRDGTHEGMPFTILDSLRSQEQQYPMDPISIRHPTYQDNRQAQRSINTMLQRDLTRTDRNRQCVIAMLSKNIDVRYLKMLQSIKNRLRSASCNRHYCPQIKERMDKHQRGCHSSVKCSAHSITGLKQCSSRTCPIATSHSSQYMTHASYHELKNECTVQTECFDCQKPETSRTHRNPGCDIGSNTINKVENNNNKCDDSTSLVSFDISKSEDGSTVSTITNRNNVLRNNSCNSFKSDECFDGTNCQIDKNHNMTTENSRDASKINICSDSQTFNVNGNTTHNNKRFYDIDEFYSCISDSSVSPTNNEMKEIPEPSGFSKTSFNKKYKETASNGSATCYTKSSYTKYKPRSIQLENNVLKRSFGKIKNNYKNCIQREVREWTREILMYPGLEKEAKEDNYKAINDCIRNLETLSQQPNNTEYEQKVKTEIETCLNRMPIWYPGVKRDQCRFKYDLIDRLFQRIKNVNSKVSDKTNDNSSNLNIKINKNTVTEMNDSLTTDHISDFGNLSNKTEIKNSVMEWLCSISLGTNNSNKIKTQMSQIADFVMFRLSTTLNKPLDTKNYKLVLKTDIVNIINDLPIIINCPKNRYLHFQKLADNLVDRILTFQEKLDNSEEKKNFSSNFNCCSKYCGLKINVNDQTENIVSDIIRKCFEDASIDCSNTLIEEAGVILLYFFKMPEHDRESNARNEVINLLVTSTNLSEVQAIKVATVLIKQLKKAFSKGRLCINSKTFDKSLKPMTLSVYTSIEELNPLNYPVTSTPKKKPVKKTIPKLNPQETQYMENVANLIRSWMDTLPVSFNAPEEINFKETMIFDLSGDIMDEIKLEQLVPGARGDDRRKYLKYFVSRWIYKLGAFEITEVDSQIEMLLDKLQEIPTTVMTLPQHGNRQAMENLRYNLNENWKETFLPKASDILEDEISIWMNEQPPDTFKNNDQKLRHSKIRNLAQVLENKLSSKRPQSEIAQDVAEWLNTIVRQDRKSEIGELAENLKHRVIRIPQDQTLTANLQIKLKNEAEYRKEISDYKIKAKEKFLSNCTNECNNNETVDQDNTMKMFISKFIEHNYDIDDPMARRAFNRLLKTHLHRLNTPTRQELYDKIGKNELDVRFPPRKLVRELEYIKLISDWLISLPLPGSYNTLGNRDRIDFVNSLAINIREVEEERENNPAAMDYEVYLISIIGEFLRLLPITEEYCNTRGFMCGRLFDKIIANRQAIANKVNEFFNNTGVNSDNIGDFIEEFIRINGGDIAQDEMKLEAWAIRLIREIKKIVRETPGSPMLSKSQIFKKISDVPIPGDETVHLFSLELEYVEEITNWLRNLPLLPINESETDNQINKICQLAEKMAELERNKATCPNDFEIDTDFKNYVAKWISELPLNRKHEIILPIVIQQLLNRMEKVKQKDVTPELDLTQSHSFNKNKKPKTALTKYVEKNGSFQSSSNLIIDVIEKWTNKLPLQENENTGTNTKNDISRKLFQIVGELNMDPRVYNDDLLYQDILTDAIDAIIDNLPQNVKNNRENLKTEIVNTIIEAKNYIKEKNAGDAYKLKLTNTIDSSIPNPVSMNQAYDPGFEIYKDRLATMFILENFDHGTDIVKIKYERLLKKEIDKYFDHAQNRNALPISKDHLYNELFRALFKVPIPNEASVIEEVEQLKTRCEIDAWFEELPINEACGLSELLELDKMLSTLTKRIHEIETSKSQSNDMIFKEIMKWLIKLPLQPGNENQFNKFAIKLLERLQSTSNQRKCVTYKSKKSKGKQKVKAKVSAEKHNDSQIAGPSNDGKMWPNVTQTPELRTPRKKAADEIFEIVHTWCQKLPISIPTHHKKEDAQMLKDNLMTKIIIKISEFNMQPDIFNNSILYDELLDEELERLLSTLPTSHEFQNSKAARKYQLKEAIKSTKHSITKERDSYRHKQELNNIVDKILGKPKCMVPDKEALCGEIKNDIIDDFVQYVYSKNDDENKQEYKMRIQNNVSKYIRNTTNKKDELMKNSLMKTNQLITELEMVSAKYKRNFRDEIEEILMKNEVTDFINTLGEPSKNVEKAKVNHLKANLANKLNEIEIDGYTPENEGKMKKEIERCLHKLRIKCNPSKIDAFINKLKNSEMERIVQLTTNKENENGVQICKEGCKHKCQSGKQGLRTDVASKLSNALSTNFARSVALNSKNKSQNRKDADRLVVKPRQLNCYENMENALQNLYMENKDSEDKYKRKCLCYRKPGGYRRRPYCMIPMRYCYDGYSPFLCRMPGFI